MMSKVFPFNFVNFFHKCWKETKRKKEIKKYYKSFSKILIDNVYIFILAVD